MAEGIEVFLLTHATGRVMEPVMGVYDPGGALEDYGERSATTERFFLVLEGELELTFDGHDPVVAGPATPCTTTAAGPSPSATAARAAPRSSRSPPTSRDASPAPAGQRWSATQAPSRPR